jgi:hypothetical protein
MGMATVREDVRKKIGKVEKLRSSLGSSVGGSLRMGTLKQLRPIRSSPLLQQAIFWPLPHLAALSWPEISIFLLPSEALKTVSRIRTVEELRSCLPGLGSGEGNSGHGGDEEGLEESHC